MFKLWLTVVCVVDAASPLLRRRSSLPRPLCFKSARENLVN
jgi:hypothetical protein